VGGGAAKVNEMNQCISVVAAATALLLSACAPSGYEYGTWNPSDPMDGGFRLHPLSTVAKEDTGNDCREPETSSQAIISSLNAKVGQFGGPSQRVVAIQGAASQSDDGEPGYTSS
jgi:hypothetical protein